LAVLAVFASSAYAADWPVIKKLSESEGVIKFAPIKTAKHRVGFAMAAEQGEYAFFESTELRAEIAYDASLEDNVSLFYDHTLARMIEGWSFNGSPSYGAKGKVVVGYSTFLYQAYTLGNGFACVGFDYQWDEPAAEPDGNPGKIMFGYVCKKQSGPLDQGQIDTFINGLDPEGAVEASGSLPKPGNASTDPAALQAGKTANRFFPFNYGNEFSENPGN
tara:strand:+ start:278 stop:934 length:657 start_codon:yes stop_codon:yes gene_type:complete